MSQGAVLDRQAQVRRGLRLEYITLSYNVVEAVVAIGFGVDAVSFWALAAYAGYEAAETLLRREVPETSWTGIALAMLSITIMPILARAKRRVGRGINSAAMVADSKQTELCSYLSAILLAGLGLNALLGWWWADPAAGLIMVPIIAREGFSAWRGEGCGCSTGARH